MNSNEEDEALVYIDRIDTVVKRLTEFFGGSSAAADQIDRLKKLAYRRGTSKEVLDDLAVVSDKAEMAWLMALLVRDANIASRREG